MEADINKAPLTVWIINPYGGLPGEGWRDYRSTLIANALADAGHNTVWWVSNFEHRSKRFRTPGWSDIQVNPHFLIRMVPSTAYTSHISLARVRYEKTFARRVYERALTCTPPDVFVLAEPALFIAPFILRLVARWRTKLVVDIIDLWPELFHIALPGRLSNLGRGIFAPFYKRRAALFRKADAIVAVTRDYLDVAQNVVKTKITGVVYLGVDVGAIEADMQADGDIPQVLRNRPKRPGEVWAIYAGTLGDNYDIRTILRAAELLESEKCPVTLLIAGDGPLRGEVVEAVESKRLRNLIYLGNLSACEVARIYTLCDIALSTYIAGSTVSMPVKAYDYMAAGLPMVNSLERELGSIVRENQIGRQYASQDPVSLARAIRELVGNPEMRRDMSANAKRVVRSFDACDQHRKFVDLIERTVGDGNSASVSRGGMRSLSGAPLLRKFDCEDVNQIVKIHLRSFPGFFLSFLGPEFLQLYYESIATTGHGIGVVSIASSGLPEGFVAGASNPQGFYLRLLKRRWFKFSLASISAVLKKPTIIPRLARAILHPAGNPVGPDVAGLFSIGVLPEAQGRGIGKTLIEAFLDEARRQGCRRVFLTTDRDNNEATNVFYAKMGFKIERQYVTPEGRGMNECWIDLDATRSSDDSRHE